MRDKGECTLTLPSGTIFTGCGKTARRSKRTTDWDEVTCPRCLEEKQLTNEVRECEYKKINKICQYKFCPECGGKTKEV